MTENTHQQLLKDKRIAVILESFFLGGAENHALGLVRHLRETVGADCKILAAGKYGPLQSFCQEGSIPCSQLPFSSWPSGNFLLDKVKRIQLALYLRKWRPHVLLTYTRLPNTHVGLIWKWTKAGVCIWNQRDEGKHYRTTTKQVRAAQKVTTYIANSEGGKQYLEEALNVSVDKVHVIQNMVQLKPAVKSREEWQKELGVNEEVFVACMVASLRPVKDHVTLLKAWKQVVETLQGGNRKAVLYLAGRKQSTTSSLKELCQQLGIEDDVQFLGIVDDITGLLSAVDIGILSSTTEGTPNCVIEYMAMGLPVVGTDIPGIRNTVGLEGAAGLAPPGDAERMAERILRLALDPEERASMGKQGRIRYETVFQPEQIAEQTVQCIAESLSLK